MEFKGVIQRKFANPVRGNTLYSFSLKGTDGFFNTNRTEIPFSEGTAISFDAVQAAKPGNFNVDVATVKQTAEVPVQSYNAPFGQRTGGAVRSAGGPMNKDQYWDRKDARDIENQKVIALQSCRNSAIAYMAAIGVESPLVANAGGPEAFIARWTDNFLEHNAAILEDDDDSDNDSTAAVSSWN